MDSNEKLSTTCMDYVRCEGAIAAGIATQATLAGGPQSADLSYVLPTARSAVVYAIALDQRCIPDYLSKRDRLAYEAEYNRVNSISSGVAVKLSGFLSQRGIPAAPLAANDVYREDTPVGRFTMLPPVSLRYLAVASGVGAFGLSGNVLDREHGACIILGAVLTAAELMPTQPLPPEANYCDECRLCMAACASNLMDAGEKTEILLGGKVFSYSKRRSYLRCQYVCGGFTGLHASGKWSTWSPGRFPLPENDDDFLPLLLASSEKYSQRPNGKGGRYHSLMDSKLYTTCGNCQIICHPDKNERSRRYKLLAQSGVIVQNQDGSLEPVNPEEALKRLAAMDENRRSLYAGDIQPSAEIKELSLQMQALAKKK